MDYRKHAMILDGATDLYILIRDTLRIVKNDQRVVQLDQATERYLKDVLALEAEAQEGRGSLYPEAAPEPPPSAARIG